MSGGPLTHGDNLGGELCAITFSSPPDKYLIRKGFLACS
jgi:hypothetical protein